MALKKISKKELVFDIRFFEGVVSRAPRFVEALAALGDAYTKIGAYNKGLRIDQRLVKLRPSDPVVWYNLACSHALTDQKDAAFAALDQAVRCGYSDWAHMRQDRDLESLRQDERFGRYWRRWQNAQEQEGESP